MDFPKYFFACFQDASVCGRIDRRSMFFCVKMPSDFECGDLVVSFVFQIEWRFVLYNALNYVLILFAFTCIWL